MRPATEVVAGALASQSIEQLRRAANEAGIPTTVYPIGSPETLLLATLLPDGENRVTLLREAYETYHGLLHTSLMNRSSSSATIIAIALVLQRERDAERPAPAGSD